METIGRAFFPARGNWGRGILFRLKTVKGMPGVGRQVYETPQARVKTRVLSLGVKDSCEETLTVRSFYLCSLLLPSIPWSLKPCGLFAGAEPENLKVGNNPTETPKPC